MAELRRRRGSDEGEKVDELSVQNELAESDKAKLVNDLTQLLGKMKDSPMPGMTHETKKCKDALKADPYNMGSILELGRAYSKEYKWEQCLNVMLRGWKRVNEFPDPTASFEFLLTLCNASLKCHKNKQALAVLNDIVDPETEEDAKMLEITKCQVYCANGDMIRGLKAFHNAITGEDFAYASHVWSTCVTYLRKAGAFDVSKNAIIDLAQTDDEKMRIEAIWRLQDLRESLGSESDRNPNRMYIIIIVSVVAIITLTFILSLLESRSLSRLNRRQ